MRYRDDEINIARTIMRRKKKMCDRAVVLFLSLAFSFLFALLFQEVILFLFLGPPRCPDGFKSVNSYNSFMGNDICVKCMSIKGNWKNAEAECRALDSRIVRPKSVSDAKRLQQHCSFDTFIVGFRRPSDREVSDSLDKSLFKDYISGHVIEHDGWNKNEPNKSFGRGRDLRGDETWRLE